MREKALQPSATLMDAVHAIEISPRRMTVVVDLNDTLIGTLTDGDVRRYLLSGGTLADQAINAMNKKPISVKIGWSAFRIYELMKLHNIITVPVISEDGRYLEILHLMDLEGDTETSELKGRTFMNAVIMAGGEGSRLRPLTADTPKPMIKVGDLPLIEHQIRNLALLGVSQVYVSVNYLGEVIENHFGNGENFGVKIDYLREKQQSGTAGSLSLLPQLQGQPILVINGDIYTSSDFNALYSFHNSINSQITIGAIDHRIEVPYGVIKMSGDFVSEIVEKPSQRYLCSAGIYAISPEVLKMIPSGEPYNMTDLIDTCLKVGIKVSAFPIHEYWSDIGTYEDLERARTRFTQTEIPSAKI